MTDDRIDCTDLAEATEIAGLAAKCIGTYPRTVGTKPWAVEPDENGEGGVAEWFGGGRHIAVTVTAHVAPGVDEDTGAVQLPCTAIMRKALADENKAAAKDKRLTAGERGKLTAALAKAKPKKAKKATALRQ